MKGIHKLVTLIEKAEWASSVYKEAALAYEASYQKFTEAAVNPRSRHWRSDALIVSLLKHCDVQGLTLQSIYKISQIVSNDLDRAINLSITHIQESKRNHASWEKDVQNEFQKVQKLVEKRDKALDGSGDLWKADFDLRKGIRAYVSKESVMQKNLTDLEQKHSYSYNMLLKTYHRTLNEYMTSAAGHLNILVNDVTDHMISSESVEISQAEPCLETPQSITGLMNTPEPDLEQIEKDRFTEIYRQAIKDKRKDLLEIGDSLSIKGCGLFLVPKISNSHLVFIICTTTEYLHAFSIQSVIPKISSDLFMGDQQSPLQSIQKALAQGNDVEVEGINKYLLGKIGSLPAIEKIFPFSLKNRSIKLQAGGRTIEISDSSAILFTKRIKIQASSVKMMRKFYSLIKGEGGSPVSHASDETGEVRELVTAWSPATYENPW